MTGVTSVTRRGQYALVEVWQDKVRYQVTLDGFRNVVRICQFEREKGSRPWDGFFSWRQIWHRAYKRKKPFDPFLTDVVVDAVWRLAEGP